MKPHFLHPDTPRPENASELRALKTAIREGRVYAPPRDEYKDPEVETAREAADKATAEAEQAAMAKKLEEKRRLKPGRGQARPPEDVALLGSSIQPANIHVGEGEVQLGEFVAAAHLRTGMSVNDWNELPETDRERLIAQEIQNAQVVAAGTNPTAETDDEEAARLLDEAQ